MIRLDGRSFTKFAKAHNFSKPNDLRALRLCNAAAEAVLEAFDDHLAFAYGESDEFSFVMKRQSPLFSRRESKILSTVVSLFSSAYVFHWPKFMNDVPLQAPPSFDGRIVLYPTTKHLRDYLAWRQADTHVNNLFNTAFWALVQKGGKSQQEAERILKGTLSKDKHEMLFSDHGINYNNEDPMFRKGSLIMKNPAFIKPTERSLKRKHDGEHITGKAVDADGDGSPRDGTPKFVTLHVDIIGDKFWNEHPHLLEPSDLTPPRIPKTAGR